MEQDREQEIKEMENLVLESLDEKGWFLFLERPEGVSIASVASALDRLKDRGIVEEKHFQLPDRPGASSWAKIAFKKGQVPEKIEDLRCDDCGRPYFCNEDGQRTIRLGYLEGSFVKGFDMDNYGTGFDVRIYNLVGAKNSTVGIYFRKDCVPDKLVDLRCKRCKRPYFSNDEVEEVLLEQTPKGLGTVNPPVYI